MQLSKISPKRVLSTAHVTISYVIQLTIHMTIGASYITFHPEASNHVHRSLSLIRSLGCKSGLVLTPSSSLEHCRYVLDQIDIILIMSVNPGFGGQSFIPSALDVSYTPRGRFVYSPTIHNGVNSRI